MRGSCFGLCTPVRSSRLPLTHTKLIHTQLSHTQLLHTAYSRTTQSHTAYSHTTLSHTTLTHTQLTHTQLSHTAFSHTTHSHKTHSHTALSHTTCSHTANLLARAQLLCGRRGTWWHRPSLPVAGVALCDIDLHFVWQAWHLWHWLLWRAWAPFDAVVAAAVCVAGVALGDIDLHFVWQLMALGWLWWRVWWSPRLFVWQAWHLVTSSVIWRGRRGTWWHRRPFCVASVALGDIDLRFVWQAWHLVTSTFTLRGRRRTYGAGLALVARLVPFDAVVAAAVCVAGVALGDIQCHLATLSHTFDALTHNFDIQFWILSLTTLSHHLSGPCPFSFLPFLSHFHICLVVIGRNWYVGVSGPLMYLDSFLLGMFSPIFNLYSSFAWIPAIALTRQT